MSIRMAECRKRSDNSIVTLDSYQKEMAGDLKCFTKNCNADISNNKSHPRTLAHKTITIPQYFKLKRGSSHHPKCPYTTYGALNAIASQSDPDIFEGIENEEFVYRLGILYQATKDLKEIDEKIESEKGDKEILKSDRQRAKRKLSSYIKTLNHILRLKTICDEKDVFKQKVHLKYYDKKIPWNKFYFEYEQYSKAIKETDRMNDDYYHPICLNGLISKVITTGKGNRFIHLECNEKYEETPITVQIFIEEDHKLTLKAGQEILAYGFWNGKQIESNKKAGFYHYNFTLKLINEGQILIIGQSED